MILHIIKLKEFSIWRRFRTPTDPPRTHERALTRNGFYTWLEELASESNTIQAQELYLRREYWSFKPCETMYIFESGFLDFLRIPQLVWCRAWCGTRYDHSGPGEIHPATREIHMEKLEVRQGDSTHYKMKEFSIWRRFRIPNDPSGTQKRALTRNGFYTWLSELVSESNTIQAQGILTRPGRLEFQTRQNYI